MILDENLYLHKVMKRIRNDNYISKYKYFLSNILRSNCLNKNNNKIYIYHIGKSKT
jgi:hypothetical protein